MNSLEREIIKELSEDARKPFAKIAEKLRVSPQTVKAKYAEMKNNGNIKLCSIQLDLRKIGYKGSAHLLITIKQEGSALTVVDYLRTKPNIVIATRTIGEFDAYAVLVFKDISDLHKSIIELKRLPDISTVDFGLAMPGLKYFPPNDNVFNVIKR